jgi:RNA polymerase sigma-70 factor (ECF subfamily)
VTFEIQSRPGGVVPIFRGKPELLRAFRAGDRAALETVYRAYVDKVAGIIRFGFSASARGGAVVSLGDRPQEIADAVQEVFARSFARTARDAFDAGRDYGPYVYTVARNVVIDWVRRAGRELPTEIAYLERAIDEWADLGEETEPAYADERTLATVRDFLTRLPPDLKEVHRVRYLEGLSQRDAAARLGISRQNLRTLERRLCDALRRTLDDAEQSAAASARQAAAVGDHGDRSEASK